MHLATTFSPLRALAPLLLLFLQLTPRLPAQELVFVPTSLQFPDGGVGIPQTDTLLLINSGSVDAVDVRVRLTPGTGSWFTLGGTTEIDSLGPGERLRIPVDMVPQRVGCDSALVVVTAQGVELTALVSACSQATGPLFTRSSDTLVLGPMLVGGISRRMLELRSLESRPLVISAITLQPAAFRLENPPSLPLVLTQGDSLLLTVAYRPIDEVVREGALVVETNAGKRTIPMAVSPQRIRIRLPDTVEAAVGRPFEIPLLLTPPIHDGDSLPELQFFIPTGDRHAVLLSSRWHEEFESRNGTRDPEALVVHAHASPPTLPPLASLDTIGWLTYLPMSTADPMRVAPPPRARGGEEPIDVSSSTPQTGTVVRTTGCLVDASLLARISLLAPPRLDADGRLQIEIDVSTVDRLELAVYDMMGSLAFRDLIEIERAGGQRLSVPLPPLGRGHYFLLLVQNGRSVLVPMEAGRR